MSRRAPSLAKRKAPHSQTPKIKLSNRFAVLTVENENDQISATETTENPESLVMLMVDFK